MVARALSAAAAAAGPYDRPIARRRRRRRRAASSPFPHTTCVVGVFISRRVFKCNAKRTRCYAPNPVAYKYLAAFRGRPCTRSCTLYIVPFAVVLRFRSSYIVCLFRCFVRAGRVRQRKVEEEEKKKTGRSTTAIKRVRVRVCVRVLVL